jgi:hypothetical protein
MVPGDFIPVNTPFSDKYTSRTSWGNETMEKSTSELRATSLGLSPHTAPLVSSGSAFDFVLVYTVTE